MAEVTLPPPPLRSLSFLQEAPRSDAAVAFTTNRYMRTEHPLIEMSACDANDRSWNPATGTERFDVTPPMDLPPPPN